MKRTLFIVNAYSGTAKTADEELLTAALHGCGLDVVEHISVFDDDLPDRASLDSRSIEVIAILSGDGTISSLSDRLHGWSGEILVLPGGTMNLLSRRLHGEVTLAQLIDQLGSAQLGSRHIPVICVGNREVFTGLTVGPSARWGEVREDIRHGDVAALAEKVPVAWVETLDDSGVWLEAGESEPYAGIFVEPDSGETLSVIAFRANNLADMVGHGIAWLRRDFREGPRDDLGTMRDVMIFGDAETTGVLIDGEVDESALPLKCTAGMSSVRFLRIIQ